jgi:RNA polymerase sigma-70 factor (ECF subfamily)
MPADPASGAGPLAGNASPAPSRLTPVGEVQASDVELVAQCRGGDAEAFGELYRRHAGRLYNLAYRMFGNGPDAEDALQEIFLIAYRKLAGFKGESALSTWLYRLAVNHCLDHLRSKAAKMGQATESLDADERGGAHAPRTAPDMVVSRVDLERAIAQLPEGCRAAFLLHDVEGLEHQEIAQVLGIATGTSKSQVHKARLKIRAYLTRRARIASVPARPPDGTD